MEKRQKDSDAVFTDNNSNNNTTIADDKAITVGTDVTASAVVDGDNILSSLLNGDNANNQQTTSDVIAY